MYTDTQYKKCYSYGVRMMDLIGLMWDKEFGMSQSEQQYKVLPRKWYYYYNVMFTKLNVSFNYSNMFQTLLSDKVILGQIGLGYVTLDWVGLSCDTLGQAR